MTKWLTLRFVSTGMDVLWTPRVRKVLNPKLVPMSCAYFRLANEFSNQLTRAGNFFSLVLLFDYSGTMSLV